MFAFLKKIFRSPVVLNSNAKIHPVVLVVLDGWGMAPPSSGNAISQANTPNMKYFLAHFPHGELIASGESVGLPANEVGNTEVGHMNMGAGRVVLQDLKKINKAIEDGSFFENAALYEAAQHCKTLNSNMHIMGLVSSGNVHSSLSHLFAVIDFCKKSQIKNVYLHLFTDGRDAPPKEGIDIIQKVETYIKEAGIGKIASISGRYFAMDRDRRWERTQKAYDALVMGRGQFANSAVEAVHNAYTKNQTDEFIEPTVILEHNQPVGLVSDRDSCIFFNFRIDRPRELTMAFVVDDFKKENLAWEFDPYAVKYDKKHLEAQQEIAVQPFKREKFLKDLYFLTMTEYQKKLAVSGIAFPPEPIKESLTSVISAQNLKQMHMSESEKERFVTYYFDGLKEERVANEDVTIVPSPKVPTYDKKPEMSAFELVYEFKKALAKDAYSFFVLNFANADMVGHTGNIQAAIKAVSAADKALGELVMAVLAVNGSVVITADHGNAEEMLTYPTASYFFTSSQGAQNTDHSSNPVPVVIINKSLQNNPKVLTRGILADIAPTILKLLGLQKPGSMTGKSLLE